MGDIKLGATLFCFGTEYIRKEYDFEECVKQAALAGATGYEIVGSQMIPSYPNVSDHFIGLVNRLKAKYGIGPEGYGANNDRGMLPDRDMTDDEMLGSTILDLKTANRLGCKVMRIQYMMSPAAFERLAPYAEIYDVKCGIEIHNPETPSSPVMKQYLDVILRSGSKYLGFIPDFGCLAIAPNRPHWMQALKMGVKEEHLRLAADCRYAELSFEEAVDKCLKAGADPAIIGVLRGMYGFVQFRSRSKLPEMLEDLKSILPYSFEMHAKFHYLNEDDTEPSIPYPEILSMLKESEYSGYIMCEYEDEILCGGTKFAGRLIAMEKRILETK